MSRFNKCRAALLTTALSRGVCAAQDLPANTDALPAFGVTVVAPFGFCGRVYEMPEHRFSQGPQAGMTDVPARLAPRGTQAPAPGRVASGADCSTRLPKFQEMQPIGRIYTRQLNVPARDFREGFPGVTSRFEWFAIDYTARFWIENPGKYKFLLLSDDGSALYIDERRIIDNDCMHAPLQFGGTVELAGGIHDIRVSYFQGPRWQVALVLYVQPPGGKMKVFSTEDFRPPANPADWKYPNPGNLDAPMDPCQTQRPQPTKLRRRD